MKHLSCPILLASLSVACLLTAISQAQMQVRAGCTLDFQHHYHCERDGFQSRLAAARTVRVNTDRMDRFAQTQTDKLVESLGKTLATPEQRPDLVFELVPVDRTGRVDMSPAAVALATFTVYDTAMGTGPQSRIWVETVDGDPDKPWPGIVTDLLRKFQQDALPH